ncbi:hypothetical protein C2R73_02445, partial [Helicobacter pylori]
MGLVFKKALEFLNFFITLFLALLLKLLFLKTGFFCFVILKFVLKNISNSFYKGDRGYFEITLPLQPPLKIP